MAVIALSAGHNRGTGARSHDGVDEWWWNTQVMIFLASILRERGHTVHELHRDRSLGYTAAMRKLGRKMQILGADLALELHFNSGPPAAQGYEFLHWWGSGEGNRLARCLATEHGKRFPYIVPRGEGGTRSLWFHRWNEGRAYSGRGGAYVYLTPCPAVICEPGFASNTTDWLHLREHAAEVALGYADGIELYLAN